MIFKEEVTILKQEIIIEVSCKKRKYAHEDKIIYDITRINNLIPEELMGNIIDSSGPDKVISNLDRPGHTNRGVWSFYIHDGKKKLTNKTKNDTINVKESNVTKNDTKTTNSRPKSAATRTRRTRSTKN